MFNFTEASPELAAFVDRDRLRRQWEETRQFVIDHYSIQAAAIELARLEAFRRAWGF